MSDYDIGAAFAAVEEELIASMIRNLARHQAEEEAEGFPWPQWQAEQLAALEDYRRRNQDRYPARFRQFNRKLEEAIRAARDQGGAEQEAAILEAIRDGAALERTGENLAAGFFQVNDRKLDALIQATVRDMEQAETAILRQAEDQYRKVIYNAQVYANTGDGTYGKAVDMATRDFLVRGIQCVVYQNGSRHTLADYADMALRTASKRAYLTGEGEMRQRWGVHTVILNKRGNACPKCARFCGKVFIDDVWSGGTQEDGDYPLLSSAVAQGLYHPRCKDSHTTYFPELYDQEDDRLRPYTRRELERLEAREQAETRSRYARRQGEKYARLAHYSLDPEHQRHYGAKAQEWRETMKNK